MALLVAGIDFDAYEVSLRDKPSEMLTRSPKGSVPVMLLPDGAVLEESWDIMRWALNQASTTNWWEPAQSTDIAVADNRCAGRRSWRASCYATALRRS